MVRGSEPSQTWLGLIRGSGEDLGSAMIRLAELAAQMHERELAEAEGPATTAGDESDAPGREGAER